MFARAVASAPDVLVLARKLASRASLALLYTSEPAREGEASSFLACDPDGEAASLDPLAGRPGLLGSSGILAAFPRFIGVAPYEAFRDLERPAWSPADDRVEPTIVRTRWLDYPAVARIDHASGRVIVAGRSRGAVTDLARALEAPAAEPSSGSNLQMQLIENDPPEAHLARVARAIELIYAGDLYQVNLARRIALRCSRPPSTIDLIELLSRFARSAPSAFGALLIAGETAVISSSPELLLDARPDALRASFGALATEPIKGTRPRGHDAPSDYLLARELDLDPKERAELSMIVDVERNDLHRVAVPGSVRLRGGPTVVTHRTLHHRKVAIGALTRSGATREDVLRAMLPSGSVTGAPKVRAMEVIRTLEPARRGLYTGAIGYQSHDGGMVLSMAIRTAVLDLRKAEGEYLVGGGIVADSDPARELAETTWKAKQLGALMNQRPGL